MTTVALIAPVWLVIFVGISAGTRELVVNASAVYALGQPAHLYTWSASGTIGFLVLALGGESTPTCFPSGMLFAAAVATPTCWWLFGDGLDLE